jgi:aarF domain-containing kinase
MEALVADVHKTGGLKTGKIDINKLLTDVLRLCYSYQIKLESRFAVIILAMGIVEGIGKKVDPENDILASAAPFVAKAMIQMLAQSKETD